VPAPWNDWYHCNGNTYGTWLRGDPRGFRERDHRRHVDGDYKNPPPAGAYDRLLARSQRLMCDPPVTLDAKQRRLACDALVARLQFDEIEVLAVAVAPQHFHVLARFPDRRPRERLGRARMHASVALTHAGLAGRVWARGCRALPIADRAHQVNVFNYIRHHAAHGAAVWTFRDPPPEFEFIPTR
jgi:hypothetical protein